MPAKKPDIENLLVTGFQEYVVDVALKKEITDRFEGERFVTAEERVMRTVENRYIQYPDATVRWAHDLIEMSPRFNRRIPVELYELSGFLIERTELERKSRTGKLLRDVRRRNGLDQEQPGFSQSSISGYEDGSRQIPVNRLGEVAKTYGFSDKETRDLIRLVRPDITFGGNEEWLEKQLHKNADTEEAWQAKWKCIHYPALDPEWLKNRPRHMQAGDLLCALREQQDGMYQRVLAANLGLERTTVMQWEIGKNPIPQSRLGDLVHWLGHSSPEPVSDERIRQLCALATLVNPYIAFNVQENWLWDQIAYDRSIFLNFPALDFEHWLVEQPKEARGALLLQAYRERAGMKVKELAEKILLTETVISRWERIHSSFSGIAPADPWMKDRHIAPSKLGLLISALNLTDREEIRQFVFAVRDDISEAWLNSRMNYTAEGKLDKESLELISWPALDPQWLKTQDRHKQAALLLTAFRERYATRNTLSEFSKKELANAIGISPQLILNWETFRSRILLTREQFKKLSTTLELSENEERRLDAVIKLSNEARKGIHSSGVAMGVASASRGRQGKWVDREQDGTDAEIGGPS